MEFVALNSVATLKAVVTACGDDLAIAVTGGERPHIGSVSVAVPRPSLTGSGEISATVSTFNVTGHLDNAIGDKFAKTLAAHFNCVCAVSCGVHIDGLDQDGIQSVLELSNELLDRVIKEIDKNQL